MAFRIARICGFQQLEASAAENLVAEPNSLDMNANSPMSGLTSAKCHRLGV